jgi:hypothetical protein
MSLCVIGDATPSSQSLCANFWQDAEVLSNCGPQGAEGIRASFPRQHHSKLRVLKLFIFCFTLSFVSIGRNLTCATSTFSHAQS